jgi:hypothetical protein
LRTFVKNLVNIIKIEFLISSNLIDKVNNPAKENINKLFEQHYGSIDESKFERLFTQYNINRVKKNRAS